MTFLKELAIQYFNLLFLTCFIAAEAYSSTNNLLQKKVIIEANRLLQEGNVSYVYGGHTVKKEGDCELCTACLEKKKPKKNLKIQNCPICKKCSLDCSHFTQLVYKLADIHIPYLTTKSMLGLSKLKLARIYSLIQIEYLNLAAPGDLLVYKGHVALLENLYDNNRGDIIHATGGKDIRLPGQGIQRERNVFLPKFRGQLKRILRPKKLMQFWQKSARSSKKPPPLRPVIKLDKSQD